MKEDHSLLTEVKLMHEEFLSQDYESALDPAHIQAKSSQAEEISKYYRNRTQEILREVSRFYSKKQIALHYFQEQLRILGIDEKFDVNYLYLQSI